MRRLFMIYGMKEINSNSNKIYKLCMQLSLKKYRDRYGLYMIEGNNLISEAVKCGIEIKCVLVREDYTQDSGLKYPEPHIAGKKLFDSIAQTETSQGIVAVVGKRALCEDDFFDLCGNGNVAVLDRLQDPGNIGTVLRTAEAAGYRGAMILKGTGDVYSPKAVRAAAGSLFRMPVLFIETPAKALEVLKSNGKKAVCAWQGAETPYYNVHLKSDIALILGNEGNGLCQEFLKGADAKAKIPMAPCSDSLNVAVAAGIIMFESQRQF